MLQNGVSDIGAIKARTRVRKVYGKPRSKVERRRFNGRTPAGVRLRMLEKQFRAQVGKAAENPIMVLAIRRASELVMLAEAKRAALIRGEAVDLSDLLRLEGVAARAVGALRLSESRREPETLADYADSLAQMKLSHSFPEPSLASPLKRAADASARRQPPSRKNAPVGRTKATARPSTKGGEAAE